MKYRVIDISNWTVTLVVTQHPQSGSGPDNILDSA